MARIGPGRIRPCLPRLFLAAPSPRATRWARKPRLPFSGHWLSCREREGFPSLPRIPESQNNRFASPPFPWWCGAAESRVNVWMCRREHPWARRGSWAQRADSRQRQPRRRFVEVSLAPTGREDRVFSVRQDGLARAPSILQLHHVKFVSTLIEIV